MKNYVSFEKVRFIVFWSKNPAPLIPHLERLKNRGINCYVQYTLNDYEAEGLEPCVPAIKQRLETFIQLAEILASQGFRYEEWTEDKMREFASCLSQLNRVTYSPSVERASSILSDPTRLPDPQFRK